MFQTEDKRIDGGSTSSDPEGGRLQTPLVRVRMSSGMENINPLTLSWKDIHASVYVPSKRDCFRSKKNDPSKQKVIIRGVSGCVKPGTLLAVMGSSGAGKSTLMNILTHRNTSAYTIRGEVNINGWNIGEKIKNVSSYVQQDDIFISTLTVREQLQFRALLRMDKSKTFDMRMARVEEVIMECGLSKSSDTRIGKAGGSLKGLSGGERKRLSFASEVLSNPPLFFLDEPTSGLDSVMALNIVQILKKMAKRGRTIISTIHQPSSEVFAMFSDLLLLGDGRVIYKGSIQSALNFFERNELPCPINFNPADHFMMTTAIVQGNEDTCRERTTKLSDAFAASKEMADIMTAIKEVTDSRIHTKDDEALQNASVDDTRNRAPIMTQLRYLFWRAWICQMRDVLLFRVRVMQSFVSAMALGSIYLQMEMSQKGVMNRNGALFVIIVNLSFSNMFAVINSFPQELDIFQREYGSKLYGVTVYYISKTVCEIPLFWMITIIYVTVVYFMMGLDDSPEAFLISMAVLVVMANTAIAFGYIISTICGSTTIALAVASPLMIPFMLFGGFVLNSDSIPVYFKFLKYLSWFQYTTEVMMANQWKRVDIIPCDDDPLPGNLTMLPPGMPDPRCMFADGDVVLEYFSFSKNNDVRDFLSLFILIVSFRLISFIALYVRARRSAE